MRRPIAAAIAVLFILTIPAKAFDQIYLGGVIRNKLGESLSTVQKFNTPLEQATTPSLEALEAFSTARRVLSTTGFAATIPFFKHAVELDPNFALAYSWLGRSYGDVGEPDMAVDYTRKAYELRDRTSEPEKYFISTNFHLEVTGNSSGVLLTFCSSRTHQLLSESAKKQEDPPGPRFSAAS